MKPSFAAFLHALAGFAAFFAAAALNGVEQTVVPPSLVSLPAAAGDAEWRALIEGRKADLIEPAQLTPDDTTSSSVRGRRADKCILAADNAAAFYAKFPSHPFAPEARRLEILSLVQAEDSGATSEGGRLERLVGDYRKDSSVTAHQRALAAGAYEFSRALRGVGRTERLAVMEKTARALVREFPAESVGYEALIAVAQASSGDNLRALAAELSASRAAPTHVRQSARGMMERYDLLGKPLRSMLSEDAIALVEKMRRGEPMVVYSWSINASGSLDFGKMIQARRFNALAVCLDGDTSAAKAAQLKLNLGGHHVYDGRGADGLDAGRLKLSVPGQIYMVDADGVIRDLRGGDNLESKLKEYGFTTPALTPPNSNR